MERLAMLRSKMARGMQIWRRVAATCVGWSRDVPSHFASTSMLYYSDPSALVTPRNDVCAFKQTAKLGTLHSNDTTLLPDGL
jgi:hypothetical protein